MAASAACEIVFEDRVGDDSFRCRRGDRTVYARKAVGDGSRDAPLLRRVAELGAGPALVAVVGRGRDTYLVLEALPGESLREALLRQGGVMTRAQARAALAFVDLLLENDVELSAASLKPHRLFLWGPDAAPRVACAAVTWPSRLRSLDAPERNRLRLQLVWGLLYCTRNFRDLAMYITGLLWRRDPASAPAADAEVFRPELSQVAIRQRLDRSATGLLLAEPPRRRGTLHT